jgi:hypothetical protein
MMRDVVEVEAADAVTMRTATVAPAIEMICRFCTFLLLLSAATAQKPASPSRSFAIERILG